MTHGMVAERLDVHRESVPKPPHGVLGELRLARSKVNALALTAYDDLSGEAMYDLAAIEGLIAGAITKIEAGVTP